MYVIKVKILSTTLKLLQYTEFPVSVAITGATNATGQRQEPWLEIFLGAFNDVILSVPKKVESSDVASLKGYLCYSSISKTSPATRHQKEAAVYLEIKPWVYREDRFTQRKCYDACSPHDWVSQEVGFGRRMAHLTYNGPLRIIFKYHSKARAKDVTCEWFEGDAVPDEMSVIVDLKTLYYDIACN